MGLQRQHQLQQVCVARLSSGALAAHVAHACKAFTGPGRPVAISSSRETNLDPFLREATLLGVRHVSSDSCELLQITAAHIKAIIQAANVADLSTVMMDLLPTESLKEA